MATQLTSGQVAVLAPRLYRIRVIAANLFKQIQDSRTTAWISWGTTGLETQIVQAETTITGLLSDLDAAINSGTYQGRVLTTEDVSKLATALIDSVNGYIELIKKWNNIFPSAKLVEFLSSTTDLAADIGAAFKGLISTGAKSLNWLPWVVGALILGPPLIRIILAGRKGGASAALQETEGSLRRGREAAVRGAKKAAGAAQKAILAAETGGASLALSGRRPRRFRRVR